MQLCTEQSAKDNCRKLEIGLFEYEKDYIEENSVFSDLVLDNFWRIFLYHWLICSLVFVAFCVHHLIKFAQSGGRFNRFVSWLGQLPVIVRLKSRT